MQYIPLNGKDKIEELVQTLSFQSFLTDKYDFLLSENLVVYGYFKDETINYGLGNLYVFGRIIRPGEVSQPTSTSIFAKLKQYAMSGKYKGLLKSKGEVR